MKLDIHPELLIEPYHNGVRLIKPDARSSNLVSIDNVFSMPLIIYFVNGDDTFIDANHLTRVTNIPNNEGYYSHTDLIDLPFNSIFCKKTTKMLGDHNRQVLSNNKATIFDEIGFRIDELHLATISFKFPVYNSRNDPVAIFGISALLNNSLYPEAEPLSKALDRIINTGLISKAFKENLIFNSVDNIYLTKQEIRCLKLLITGKSFRLIGNALKLSPRTVEHYIENIKHKLNVKTKADLIEKVIQQICPNIFD